MIYFGLNLNQIKLLWNFTDQCKSYTFISVCPSFSTNPRGAWSFKC